MGKRSVSKKIATGIAIGVTALSLLVPALVTAPAVYAESDAQNGPAYDFGRGGAKMPGQPACCMPAPDETRQPMCRLNRPACMGKMM